MSDVDLSGGKPDESLNPNEVKTLQTYTEASIRKQIAFPVQSAWDIAQNSLLVKLIGGVFSGVAGIITGAVSSVASWFPSEAKETAIAIRDKQEDLNDRQDLVDPLLNYCSLYPPVNGPQSSAIVGSGTIPFSEIVGYHRNVEVVEPGVIRLKKKGTWDYSIRVTNAFYSFPVAGTTGYVDHILHVIIKDPDGVEWSRESMAIPQNFTSSNVIVAGGVSYNPCSGQIIGSVQVPKEGYTIEAYIQGHRAMKWRGGPQWCRMRLQNISSEYFNDAKDGNETSTNESVTS